MRRVLTGSIHPLRWLQAARPLHDEWHVDKFFICDKRVANVLMVAQPIAMIGDDDGEGVGVVGTAVKRSKQLAQIPILIRHFGIIHIVKHAGFQLAHRLFQGRPTGKPRGSRSA